MQTPWRETGYSWRIWSSADGADRRHPLVFGMDFKEAILFLIGKDRPQVFVR
jgi:hypothetical protein